MPTAKTGFVMTWLVYFQGLLPDKIINSVCRVSVGQTDQSVRSMQLGLHLYTSYTERSAKFLASLNISPYDEVSR